MKNRRKKGRNYTLPRAFLKIREDRIYDVPLSEISETWRQRRAYDEVKVAMLASSIRENGLCEPVLLLSNRNKIKKRVKDGLLKYITGCVKSLWRRISRKTEYDFSLISGGYRLRAYRLLGKETIPARFLCENIAFLPDAVRKVQKDENKALCAYISKNEAHLARKSRLAAALCAHVFTQEPHYFDIAERLSLLCSVFGCRINHLAAVLTLDKAETERKVSLLLLSDPLRDRLLGSGLSADYALLLLRLPNDPMRSAALDRILEESMSFPDAERLIAKMCSEGERSYTQVRQFYCKDPRILVNSVVKAAKSIEKSGLNVSYNVVNNEDGATVTVHVDKPTAKDTANVSRETCTKI